MLAVEKIIASYYRRVLAEKNESAIEKKKREKDISQRYVFLYREKWGEIVIMYRCPHVTL